MNPSVSSLHSSLKKEKRGKQLLARRVASIRWWIEEKRHASMLFTPLAMRKSATLSFYSEERGEELCQVICFVPK